MNICFVTGKVISNIDFRFIIDDKINKSVSIFKIELSNKSKVMVKGYTNVADFCYRNLTINNVIMIEGFMASGNKIIINEINILN